jgi:hypothetical protein
MRMDPDIFNYLIMLTMVAMIAGSWVMLSTISLDNNKMLRNVTNILNTQTGNLTNQAHSIHVLDEILSNVTSSNGVLMPKPH